MDLTPMGRTAIARNTSYGQNTTSKQGHYIATIENYNYKTCTRKLSNRNFRLQLRRKYRRASKDCNIGQKEDGDQTIHDE